MKLKPAPWILFLLISLTVSALADGEIVISLDPPAGEKKDDLRLDHETTGATQKNTSTGQYVATAQTTQRSSGKEVIIGRVGAVIADNTRIMRGPSTKGYPLYTCPKDTYLAIIGESGRWYGVLMADGSTGWVERTKVRLLNYHVKGQKCGTTAKGERIVNTALKYLGIPYQWGGYSFDGLDCSGFVKAVFESNGISLPRTSREQACVGTPVGYNDLRPGDRLYFACKGGAIDHTGIYMGNGLFIHSSSSRGGVAIDNLLTNRLYYTSLVAARR